MGKLSYEEFTKKYVLDIGGNDLKNSLLSIDTNNLDIFDEIFDNFCKNFYEDYLNGKLSFIEESDKIENNNENNDI